MIPLLLRAKVLMVLLGFLVFSFAANTVDAQSVRPGYPNHNLHNFGVRSNKGNLKAWHCLQMGYYFSTIEKPDKPGYAGIGVIKNTNAVNGPFRLYENRATGELSVSWGSSAERRQDDLHPLALLYGLENLHIGCRAGASVIVDLLGSYEGKSVLPIQAFH